MQLTVSIQPDFYSNAILPRYNFDPNTPLEKPKINIEKVTPLPVNYYSNLNLDIFEIKGFDVSRDIANSVFSIDRIENRILNNSIFLTVRNEDNIFIVENEELNLWGDGDTLDEAIVNFEKFFIYDYKTYQKAKPTKLDDCAKELFAKYKKYLNKI